MGSVANDLQAGFKILWYEIESVLGRGGFGITYLARDNNLGQLVAIKEYLPHEFATRSGDSTVQPVSVENDDVFSWGLERFMSEAQTLAKFKHPNIVRVLSVFKHNNTGYMVMEYEQGKDLSNVYKQSKKLSQKELEDIYYPIIDGLASVHKEGFIHRDIKPANIYIRDDGSPVLIDFGAARQAVGAKTKTLTSLLSIGYAPFEQYNDASGKQGPWTDIYALGASLHQGITGEKPIESTIRGMALLHDEPDPYQPLSQLNMEGYSHAFLRAIDQALMLQIYDRPQTLEEFLALLKGEITLPDLPRAAEKVSEATIIRPGKRKFSGAEVTQPDTQKITEKEQARTGSKDETDSVKTEGRDDRPSQSTAKSLKIKPIIIYAIAAIVAISIAIVVILPGEKSPEELQQQKLDELIKKADEQVTNGNLYSKSGNGALSIYQQILKIEPNSSAAQNGIRNIAEHYLRQAEEYIDSKDFNQASTSLGIVKSIAPEFRGLEQVQTRFTESLQAEKKFRQIELLLNRANASIEKGNSYEPEQKNAYYYFQNVLKIDPDNVTARLGLLKIAETILLDAKSALKKEDINRTETLVNLGESIDPGNAELKTIRAQIKQKSELRAIMAKADKAYSNKRYIIPENNNAYTHYKEVLAISPTNSHAQEQLNRIADYYSDLTRKYSRSGKITSANSNLKTLETYFPDDSAISALRREISNKQSQLAKSKQGSRKTVSKQVIKKPVLNSLLPVGVNQKQDDYQVVQDIVGLFINALKSRDMANLLKVSQLNAQTKSLYASIFKSYQSLNVKVVPNSFTLSKKDGTASVKFEIIDLVNTQGNQVITSANWTKIELKITKKNGIWEKATII